MTLAYFGKKREGSILDSDCSTGMELKQCNKRRVSIS